MKNKTIIFLSIFFIGIIPSTISVQSSAGFFEHNINNIQVNVPEVSSESLKNVEYSYLAGDYWFGEIKIDLKYFSNNTIVIQSKVTKEPHSTDSVQLSDMFLTNTSFKVYLYGYQTNFTNYVENANITSAPRWLTIGSNDSRTCSDCSYHRYIINATDISGNTWSAVDEEPELAGYKYPNEYATESLTFSLQMLKDIISGYKLDKIDNGATLTITATGSSSISLPLNIDGFMLALVSIIIILKYKSQGSKK